MSKKITLEEKMEKRDKLKARIDKNLEDMKPTYKAYEKLEKEINAELEEIKQKEKNKIYEHVMSLFGYSLSSEDFIKKFDRIMNDNRNRGFIEQLKHDQAEREKLKNEQVRQNIDAKNTPGSSPCPGENVTADPKS